TPVSMVFRQVARVGRLLPRGRTLAMVNVLRIKPSPTFSGPAHRRGHAPAGNAAFIFGRLSLTTTLCSFYRSGKPPRWRRPWTCALRSDTLDARATGK